MMGDPGSEPRDEVRERRRRAGRAATLAQRGGWLLFAASAVAFGAGFTAGFTPAWVRIVVGTLIAGSVLLAPGIVLGYAVRAAEREDRERGL